MATTNQFSTTDWGTNLLLNALNKPDKSALVYDLSGGYNVIDLLATRNRPAREIVGNDGYFEKPIIGRSGIVQQVASTSLSGTTLTVNWVDPTFDLFRNTFVLTDGTAGNYLGRVIAHQPGSVQLEAAGAITTWNTSTHFVAGSYALEVFNASINRGSDAVESLYEYPSYIHNQTSICRDNVQLFRRDFSSTYPMWKNGFWATAQDDKMVQRYAYAMDMKALFDQYASKTTTGGTVNYSMGIKQAIQDPYRGGVYLGLSNAMTRTQFENWLGQIADRQASTNTEINLLVGRGAMDLIQSFYEAFIQFGGSTNTFGGATVKGVDIKTASFNGIHVNFIMLPLFNDRDRFPAISTIPGLSAYSRMQYTIVALDLNDYNADGGGSLPALEKCYFGSQEMVYFYTPGIVGSNVKGGDSMYTQGNPFLAANGKDGVTFGMYSDICYDYVAYRSGWLEVIV